ncbi:CpsD/CapB family tyrosine-protein kinase [Paenibacillus sp. CAU 1782]
MVRERTKAAKKVVNRSLIAYLNPSHHISQQFRAIRNNIQYASEGNAITSLLVTSPEEGDGKSTVAINLAISMAQRGEQVLLIDANFRNPVLHKIFGTQMSPGLASVVSEQLSLPEAVRRTEVEGLDLLTCGSAGAGTADLLDSPAMNALMALAAATYDRVIIDSPAVLSSPDTNCLAGKSDGVVLLLRCGSTTHGKALEAKQALTFAGANIVGAVLNKKNAR